MARRLILPLILLLALAAVLIYVGGDQVVRFEVLPEQPEQGRFISMQAVIIFSALVVISIVLLWSILVWVWKLPRRMKSQIGRKREDRGLEAIEQVLLATEAGDAAGARKKAKQAKGLLNRPALTALISARAAELGREDEAAQTHYNTLLENPKTELAGLRGLARIAETRADYKTAIDMAKAALQKHPGKNTVWAFKTLFNGQTTLYDWAGALETLELAEKSKSLDKDEIRRRRSVLLSARAAKLMGDGQEVEALDLAKKAAGMAADFAPATALAARLLAPQEQTKTGQINNGHVKKAAHLIEKAWVKNPHPALALAYKDLWQGEDDKTLSRKIKTLIKTNPSHRESSILTAELALDNGDGVAALSALDALLQGEDPSARVCMLSAQAETLLDNEIDARMWQHRAACAPVEANWSDLDPNGPAFNYTAEDWRQMVFSFGSTGVLLHPRHAAYKGSRAVIVQNMAGELGGEGLEKAENTPKKALEENTPKEKPPLKAPSADDPGIDDTNSSQNLAGRLENLLDDSGKR